MATNEKPIRGILKNSTSFDRTDHHGKKEMTWDEMNIVATYHPADKDYGHMKIDDPPTPYSKYEDPEDVTLQREGSVDPVSEDETDNLDPDKIAKRLTHSSTPKVMAGQDDSSDEEEHLSPEEKAKKRAFEQKRKLHYNEFQAVKLAKQLMEQDEEEEEEEDEERNETAS